MYDSLEGGTREQHLTRVHHRYHNRSVLIVSDYTGRVEYKFRLVIGNWRRSICWKRQQPRCNRDLAGFNRWRATLDQLFKLWLGIDYVHSLNTAELVEMERL